MTMADHVAPDAAVATDIPLPAPVPAAAVATYDELKAGCLGADPAFLCGQLEAKATLPQAQSAWMAEQNRRLAAANERAQQAALRQPGVDPLPAGGKLTARQFDGDPIAAFEEAVHAEMDRTGAPRHIAQRKVCTSQPELREALVAVHNARFSRVRQ
jgi:hypothetical protein